MVYPYRPIWYFVGVFVTAFSIAFYQYRVLFPYWFSEFESLRCLNYMMVPALFFAITIIYSIDHWLDLKQIKALKGTQISEFYRLFYARYPMVIIAILLFVISDSGGFRKWLSESLQAIWLPAIFFALYIVNFFLSRRYFVRGIKEVLIVAAVVSAVYCPVLMVSTPCRQYFVPSFYQIASYVLICLLNMNLFSYMEKEKDEFYQFRSAYIHLSRKVARSLFLGITLVVLAVLFTLFFMNKTSLGFVLCGTLFCVTGLLKHRITKQPSWRIFADLLLILPALI